MTKSFENFFAIEILPPMSRRRKGRNPNGSELVSSSRPSPTEQRNRRSMNLHKMPLSEAIELMLSEEQKVPDALRREGRKLERLIDSVVRCFRRDGRLFYVGAGTSGRLGVLDASECPPTFRTPARLVRGIIAGGNRALTTSIEGAEDDFAAGASAIQASRVNAKDVVLGIAASGCTPFVWGALKAAKERGATTALLCFNPYLKVRHELRPTMIIAPNVGPEVLTGSTRLKAGSATKLVLNMVTTLAMVRLGKVFGNLMVDLKPTNAKLRDRAARIVQELTNADYQTARAALQRSGWNVRSAVARLSR